MSDALYWSYFGKAGEAYEAGQYKIAIEFFKQALGFTAEESNKLLCKYNQALCYNALDEDDEAIEIYITIASCKTPGVDQDLIVLANQAIIDWALDEKDSSFIEKSLDELESFLRKVGRTDLEYRVSYFQGELEDRKGNFTAAHLKYLNAWKARRSDKIRGDYSAESYLNAICRSSLYTQNQKDLKFYLNEMDHYDVHCERCECIRYIAKLYYFRANLLEEQNRGDAYYFANELLRHLKVLDLPISDTYHSAALYMFLLLGKTEEAQSNWEQLKPKIKKHEAWVDLFEGDLYLHTARKLLNLNYIDDDWMDDAQEALICPAKSVDSIENLKNSKESYEKCFNEYGEKDKRLGTTYYSNKLRKRIRKVETLLMSK